MRTCSRPLHANETGRSTGGAGLQTGDVGAGGGCEGDSGQAVDGVVAVAVAVAVGVCSESPSFCQFAVVLSVSQMSPAGDGGSGATRWALSWACTWRRTA